MSAFMGEITLSTGAEIHHLIGQPIEVLSHHSINRGKPSSSQWRETHSATGILVGTFDKWVNDEIASTTILLAGGGGMHNDRSFTFRWSDDGDIDSVTVVPLSQGGTA